MTLEPVNGSLVDRVEVGFLKFSVSPSDQWLFLVPLKGGIGGIVHPPIGRKNATYIPLIYCLQGGGLQGGC